MTILIVNKYLTAFDAANNNVVQGAGRVNTGLSGHDRKAINLILNSQVYMLRVSLSFPLIIFMTRSHLSAAAYQLGVGKRESGPEQKNGRCVIDPEHQD